ncbi:MAG: hypothetical protein ACRDJU_12900 [Actinomycetota bacterium]
MKSNQERQQSDVQPHASGNRTKSSRKGDLSATTQMLRLQRSIGNQATAALVGQTQPQLTVQRRGNLAQIAAGTAALTVPWDAIYEEIREEYAVDHVLAGEIEDVYWELKNAPPATLVADLNRRVITPLNGAIAAATARQDRARWASDVVATSRQMTVMLPDHRPLVPALIEKWNLDQEAATQKRDQLFYLTRTEALETGVSNDVANKASNKQGNTYRIDREGPAQGGRAAQFRLQLGTATYGGLHLQLNEPFDAQYIRDAWTLSVARGRTVYVHK